MILKVRKRFFSKLVASLLVAHLAMTTQARAQPAPARRAVISHSNAPESVIDYFEETQGTSTQEIKLPEATWLMLQIGEYNIAETETLVISPPNEPPQRFERDELEAWEGLSARFGTDSLTVAIEPASGNQVSENSYFTISDITIGLPEADGTGESQSLAPRALIDRLGVAIDRYIINDQIESRLQPQNESGEEESLCGADDRTRSNDVRVGRIMPVGCTGWLIDNSLILTAGHCVGDDAKLIEFNVPESRSNGRTVPSAVKDQYRLVSPIQGQWRNLEIGADWAIFRARSNTESDQTPHETQGATFQISNSVTPANVSVTGYGRDSGIDNLVQQTHSGPVTKHEDTHANTASISHQVDTRGGASGASIHGVGEDVAIGIHTNAGCGAQSGSNSGTSFRNQQLWNAIIAAGAGIQTQAASAP